MRNVIIAANFNSQNCIEIQNLRKLNSSEKVFHGCLTFLLTLKQLSIAFQFFDFFFKSLIGLGSRGTEATISVLTQL